MSVKEKEIHEESWLKSVIKHGKWYIFSSIFGKGLSLILLPIYTKYLTPTDYGILGSLFSIEQLLPIFISLYLDAAFVRYFHEYKNDKLKLQELFSSIYWFVSIYGFIVVLCCLFLSQFWFKSLLHINIWPYALLSFFPPLFSQLGALGVAFLMQSLKAKETTLIQIAQAFITMIVTLPLLIFFNYGVIAKLIGGVASSLFLFSFYTIFFIRNGLLRFRFNKTLIISCIVYSVPLIPQVAGQWITGLSDRLILAKFSDLKSVGLYSLAFQFGLILYLIQDAITQVQGPVSMSGLIHDKEKTKIKIADFSLFLLAVMLFFHLGLFLFSQEVIYFIVNNKFYEAYKMVAIIGFAYILQSQYRIFGMVIAYHKKNWVFSSGGILAAITSVCFNFFFIPKYGYYAASVSVVVSMFVYSFWIFFWSQKYEYIYLHWKKSCFFLIAHIFIILITLKINIFNHVSFFNFMMKNLFYFVYILLLYFMLFKKYFSFQTIKDIIQKRN